MLSTAGNTDPNIASFPLEFSGRTDGASRTRWLRTSPEYPLKRLLAAGIGDCYELGRVFRDGEAGGRHNPEFTMLEWYRVGWDHLRLIDEAVDLVRAALALVDRSAAYVRKPYRDVYLDGLGLDPFTAAEEALRSALGDIRIDADGLTRDDWLDLLMTPSSATGLPGGATARHPRLSGVAMRTGPHPRRRAARCRALRAVSGSARTGERLSRADRCRRTACALRARPGQARSARRCDAAC